jgi:WD40-like Beta Propeller Repeat
MTRMRAFVLGVVVAVIGACAPAAWGAFPGRDGDLVVATGGGLELVATGTGASRSICTSVVLCGHPAQPSFSPNGQAITFVDTTSGRPVVVAADGSCLWCLLGAPLTTRIGSEPAFTPGGQGVTAAGNGLWRVSLTGGGARRLLKGPVDGAVWSSRGLVALVRRGWIWVGRPGHGELRRLARGRSPSFSPDGVRLAVARNGYVWIVRVADGTERRLVRGRAPAWSPSGRQIAYIAAGGAVETFAVHHGGRPRKVGSVRGTALDWQPLPVSERHTCTPPRGSTVLASNREAVVFSQRGLVFYGCLNALGRTRLLLDASNYYFGPVMAVTLAGRFAAVQAGSGKPPNATENETLYDVSSGNATDLATVPDASSGGPIGYRLDPLALDSSGFAAWRETMRPVPVGFAAISCPSASLCVAGDQAGNVLNSTNPTGGSTAWNSAGALISSPSSGGVSCPSISLCAAVGSSSVLTATDPSGGASAWTTATIGGYPALGAISCPSVSLCVGVGGGPNILTILTSTDPTGGASSWITASIPYGGRLSGVSCPSVSLCVATTNRDVFTSTNPTGGASAWTKTTVDPGGPLDAVSCPSVSLCVAVDSSGNALASTNPGGGTSTWTTANIDPGYPVWAVSCPSASLCVAVDLAGNVLTSTDPTGGASAWTKTPIDQRTLLLAVSCPSVSLCVAVDLAGNVLTSTDPTGGANTWTSATVDIPGCPPQSAPCISEQLYARDDHGTRVVDTAPPGQGNSIGNVALDSLVLNWTHDSAQRQLQLR